jgi:hypothetical protein
VSFFSVCEMIDPISSRSGKKMSTCSTPFSWRIEICARGQLLVRLHQHLAGAGVDDVLGREGAFELLVVDPHGLDAALAQRGDRRVGDLLALGTTMSLPGISMSSPARRPTRLSFTVQKTVLRRYSRSTV